MKIFLTGCLACVCSFAQAPASKPIDKIVEGTTRMPGFLPLYWDARAGKLWLEIGRWNSEFLYYVSLPAGLGSNDIGLDRGQLGPERIVRFERVGPHVLMVQPNYAYRAVSENPDERRSVEEAFAQSVIWGFQVEGEEGERVLVDATPFFLRDAHGVVNSLTRSRQGTYRLEPTRSALFLPRTKSFPKNTEVEVTLTFTGEQPGEFVRQVTPSPDAITVRQHHSFVQLPGPGYQPREFDPRAGFFGITYMDLASPISQPISKRYIARHRLTAGQPIVYYLDRGAPEPIRSALLDGAHWWAEAFAAAGFRDGFRVELMPEGADPMDMRYNVIQWVHRATRGWSYGNTVMDPRTGEILKGHVTLGSLRVRQDYLIATSLLAPFEDGKPVPREMEEMALARLRQLSAHEVGHTLGLAHNYISSAAGRASVMDYPHPLVSLEGTGAPAFKSAYTTSIGEWDKVAIAYGYSDPQLPDILMKAQARGLSFITDADSRPPGGAHPTSHLWDNGANAAEELNRIMTVRARALERFSERNIRAGQPLSTLEEVLVPLYLLHRYQVEAAAKVLGGLEYTYALKGDKQVATAMVPADQQRKALRALLKTMDAEALTLPERIVSLIAPRAYGYPRNRETFLARTGVTFDPVAAAESAASLTVGLILHPERASRLVELHARSAEQPGLPEVIDALLTATWKRPRAAGLTREVQRAVDWTVLYHLMFLASNESASRQAKAIASFKLATLRTWCLAQQTSEDQTAHLRFAAAQIKRFEEDPKVIPLSKPLEAPPGQPI